MRLSALTEGVAIALDSIRANKLRSGLTVLGVVIGVSTVMAMASIVNGIRGQIINTIEVVGPTTIRVFRFFSSTPVNPDALPREVRIRPKLEAAEAEALADLPEIGYAAIWVGVLERLAYRETETQPTVVYGADERFMEILGGGIAQGRLFTPTEARTGRMVALLEVEAAQKVFGRINPLGKTMRIAGRPFQVVGVYRKPENIFQPPGQEIAAIVPFEAARRSFRYDDVNSTVILVKPVPAVPVDRAMDVITVQFRKMRGLRPGNPDTFDLVTSEQVLGLFNRLTGVFFLVMIVLSSVALLVGGVLGVVVGLAAGQGLKNLMNLQSAVPIWSAVVASLVSVAIGLVFGLLPAGRAARLDPIEALRYE